MQHEKSCISLFETKQANTAMVRADFSAMALDNGVTTTLMVMSTR